MTDTKTDDPASKDNKDDSLAKKDQGAKDDAASTDDSLAKATERGDNQEKRAKIAEKERDDAKAKYSQLEKDLADKADSKDGEVSDKELQALADKHDVSVDLLKDLKKGLVGEASKAAEKLVSDKLSEKDKEDKKKSILNAFKKDFDKIVVEWEGSTLSEKAVRMHYLTEKAKNADHTVADSVEDVYGSFKTGKPSADDDARGADTVGETIDFQNVSKDQKKLAEVLKDPKAKKAYYAWRDTQGL